MKSLCEEQNLPNDNKNINSNNSSHENNGTTHRNGSALYNRNGKPAFARFENDDDSTISPALHPTTNEPHSLSTVDENEETRFINNNNQNYIKKNININNNNNNKNTKPSVRNRGSNSKFRNHRNSLHGSRHTIKPGAGGVNNKNASRDTNGAGNDEDEEEGDMLQNLDKIYKLDVFARTVLPLFYVIFTVAYFVFYSGTVNVE